MRLVGLVCLIEHRHPVHLGEQTFLRIRLVFGERTRKSYSDGIIADLAS